MGSIPLPALDVRPPQQPEQPMQQVGQLLQLRNMLQNAPLQRQAMQQQLQEGDLSIQQKQQQLKDQQAMTSAMQQWDGKDVNQLVPLVIKNGASANAVMGLKSKVLEQQQAYSKIAADDATTGAKNLETMKGKNDMIAGALDNVRQMPDNQISQGLVSTANDLLQKGLIDPQHAQVAAQLAQSGDPNAIRQQLGLMQKGLMSESQQMEAASKQAQIRADNASAAKNEWELKNGGPLTDQNSFVNNWLATKGLANTPQNRLLGQQEYIKETKIAPAQVRAQVMLQTPTQVFNPETGQNEYTTRANAVGKLAPSSADALAAKAGVQADASSLKSLQKQFDSVSAFETTAGKNIDMALQKAAAIPDLGSRFANVPVRMINDKMLGTKEMAEFRTAMATAQTEAAKVLNSANASGVLSDSARHELEDITNGNLPLAAMKGQWSVIKQDMQNRHDSYQQQIGEIQNRLRNGGQQPKGGNNNDPLGIR